jgi:HSP20 family protein
MEKALEKTRSNWPTLFDAGWMEKFFNAPLDEYFNFGKVMNIPAVNVSETDKEFRLFFAVPGFKKSDFKIEFFDEMLTISAEKEKEEYDEKSGRYNRREYNFTSWSRSFTLPEYVNSGKIEAKYENGELKIILPKLEIKEPKLVKTINVN